MMKSTKNTSLILSALILAVILLLLVVSVRSQMKAKSTETAGNLKLEVFEEPNGWGYNVVYHDRIIIRQDIIPAIPKSVPFRTEADARKTGTLVVGKLQSHQRPTISLSEIDSLKIEI